MPIVAFLVLLWQRRRVLSWWRRARVSWADRPSSGAANRAGRAAAAAGWLGARAWRAIDTPENAARAERLVARIRVASARAEGSRTAG